MKSIITIVLLLSAILGKAQTKADSTITWHRDTTEWRIRHRDEMGRTPIERLKDFAIAHKWEIVKLDGRYCWVQCKDMEIEVTMTEEGAVHMLFATTGSIVTVKTRGSFKIKKIPYTMRDAFNPTLFTTEIDTYYIPLFAKSLQP